MERLRVYLDTSVVSYLKQDDAPERMAETLQFWKMLENGEFDVYLSQVTLGEIGKCYEPKRSELYRHLDFIDFVLVEETEEQEIFAQKIIDAGILKKKSRDDCRHLAAAISAKCDCVVSWNFKHLVNIKTIRGVRQISLAEGKQIIDIVSPDFFLHNEEENDETDAESRN